MRSQYRRNSLQTRVHCILPSVTSELLGALRAMTVRREVPPMISILHGGLSEALRTPKYNVLARVSHRPTTTPADLLAVTGRTPSGRLNVVSATPSPSSGPCPPSQRHLDALATNSSEISGPEAQAGPISLTVPDSATETIDLIVSRSYGAKYTELVHNIGSLRGIASPWRSQTGYWMSFR